MKYFIATLIFLSTGAAQAEDVYNFYFQKAPGPQSVQQGSSNSGDDLEDVAADTKSDGADLKSIEDELDNFDPAKSLATESIFKSQGAGERTWKISLGLFQTNTMYYSEYWGEEWYPEMSPIVGLSYRFHKRVTAGLGLFGRTRDHNNEGLDFGDFLLNLEIKLFSIRGWNRDLIDFNLLGGSSTIKKSGKASDISFISHFGAGLNVNFSEDFSLVGQ